MIELPYTLVIEATDEPDYFGFYSPDLEGFFGIGHPVLTYDLDIFFNPSGGTYGIQILPPLLRDVPIFPDPSP